MKNFVQAGAVLNLIATAAVVGGTPVVLGAIVGVPASSGVAGDLIAVNLTGVYTLPKTAGQAPAQGARVYWDATAGSVTTSAASGANNQIGYVADAGVLAGDATVNVVLVQP